MSSTTSPGSPPGLHRLYGVRGNERIGAFSDGIFTITITLLVLGLQVPNPANVPPEQLGQALLRLVPNFAGHIVSFVVLGIYWVGQHNQFLHIKRHDRTFLWLNILFLLFVGLMPFCTGLLVNYPQTEIAVVFYAGTLVLAGLALELIWWYATAHHRLVDPALDPALIAFVHRRVLTAPAIYAISVAVSFFSIPLAELLFFVVAFLYIVPNPMDHYHSRQLVIQHEGADAQKPETTHS